MGLFFNYDNPVCNEGATPVVFSYDPSIISLKELLIYELSQMAYYEEKLRKIGYDTGKITDLIINYITLTVVNLDFQKDVFLNIIKNLYDEVQKLTLTYKEECKLRNEPFEPVEGEKLSFETKNENIDALKFGEKQSVKKNTSISKFQKTATDIAVMLISNACLCITEIENYEEQIGDEKFKIPELLKAINYDNLSEKELKNHIIDFAKTNREIMTKLNRIICKKYGPIEETDVKLNIKKGKCILVSGHYYKNLEMLLEAVKDEDINVYTHNEMLFAQSFSYFHKYKNLAGHYQRSLNNVQLDFASFPGAVLITKNSHFHFDFIRGRVFTPDNNPAYGISKISENDFTPLIEAAKKEKGFTKDITIGELTVGYDQNFIDRKLQCIIECFNNGKYNHLIIIGTNNYNVPQTEYFEKLFDNLPNDCFVISFSYNRKKDNIWHIGTFYDMSLIYNVFDKLKEHENILKEKTTAFITQCHLQTISHAFNLKILGIKNIFLSECCPNVINPSIFDGMKDIFSIKKISASAENDLKEILKN